MAMTKCKECGSQVSDKATSCPTCGLPIKPKTSKLAKFALVGVFAAMAFTVATRDQTTHTPPAESKADENYRYMLAAVRTLKQAVKNPDSFKLVSAVLVDNDVACIRYRATNSFNAIVPGHAVLSLPKKLSSSDPSDWNSYCAEKTGTGYEFPDMAL